MSYRRFINICDYFIRHDISEFKTIVKNFILYKTSLRREWIHALIDYN